MTTDDDRVLATWRRQLASMDRGDVAAIRACFSPDAVLVHMTGYVQPLDEWLEGVRTRHFVYHRLEERSVEILDRTPSSARVVGHVTTGITDDGSGHAWPLRIEQTYALGTEGWRCTRSQVTLDRHA